MRQTIRVGDIWAERTTPVDPDVVDALAEDIKINGLRQPLIVDHQHELIDGLLRFRALQQLGEKTVEVEVARTLAEAVEALKELHFDPQQLSLRRRRDFNESLNTLISEHVSANLRRRNMSEKPMSPEEGTRVLVSTVLGYPWFRIRRVFRWIESEPNDPHRQEILRALELGLTSVNKVYPLIRGFGAPKRSNPRPSPSQHRIVGDITGYRDQLHLMEELNRQLSGAIKGANTFGFPVAIPPEEFQPLLNQLAKHRAELSRFIGYLRKEIKDK